MSKLIHRSRVILAKALLRTNQIARTLTRPSDNEILLDRLPVVASVNSINGQTVVITGSTEGIGLAIARRFLALGANVVINGRRAATVEQRLAELKQKHNGRVIGLAADAASEAGARSLIEGATKTFGSLNILINNAAVGGSSGKAWEDTQEAFDEVMRINVSGPFLCARAAILWMLNNRTGGRIINISTIATESIYPGIMPYVVSKTALEAMTRQLAADLPDARIIVMALTLPSVQTDRKFARDWAHTELLPPVESVLPALEYVATGPAHLLHGRTLSAARFNLDPHAESLLAGPNTTKQQMLYPLLSLDGMPIERQPSNYSLLDRAENGIPTSPNVLAAIKDSLGVHPPSYYPDDRYSALKHALSQEYDLDPDCFALGPGSWEVLNRLVDLFVKPGEEVISNEPGWFGFNLVCRRHGVRQKLVPFGIENMEHPSHNLAGIKAAITPSTRMIYLISPGNPEGSVLKRDAFEAFLADVPPALPIVIDEAYAEFADDDSMVDIAAEVRRGERNVIGLRTFSKFHGLAGLRVGYAYARPAIAELIRRLEHIFCISHVAEAAAIAALQDGDHRAKVYANTVQERTRVTTALRQMGTACLPSQAPYILAARPKRFDEFVQACLKEGSIVPPYQFCGGKYFMFPVGRHDQNNATLMILKAHV